MKPFNLEDEVWNLIAKLDIEIDQKPDAEYWVTQALRRAYYYGARDGNESGRTCPPKVKTHEPVR